MKPSIGRLHPPGRITCALTALLAFVATNALAGDPAPIGGAGGPANGQVVVADPLHQIPADKRELMLLGGVSVVDAPGRVLPPQPDALSCGATCTVGTSQATHPYYDVFQSCGNGAFTARTGSSHSVTALAGSAQNVIFGGSFGSPGTSDVTWYFHDQALAFQNPAGGAACVFDPPDTAMEPASVGVEQEWTVSPGTGLTCTLREEIVAFGTTEANSGIRMTLATTNMSSSVSTVNVGVRWQIDCQNTTDDGPWFATVTCNPATVVTEWSTEHELLPSEIHDFYRIQNNTGSPIFSNVTSTTAIVGIPDTSTPDRLIYGRWPSLRGSTWNYAATEGACCPDSDSAVLWYHGYLPVDGDVLAPGQSSRHTIVIFTSADTVDCGGFTPGCATSIVAPPTDQTICLGGSATLDATGVTLTDCAGAIDYSWTDGTNTWSGPVQGVSPTQTTRYTVTVSCDADPACHADISVTVTVDQPPLFQPPIGTDPDACNLGIRLGWNPAAFLNPSASGVYNIYRSEVSCADALLLPPIARGLTTTVFGDRGTQPGHTYYYAVEAEDATAGTMCAPRGPNNGGSVTRLCAPPVVDTVADLEPAALGPVLRARHVGDIVTMDWSLSRALAAMEHFHLKKGWFDASCCFIKVNPEGDTSTSFTEVDTSAWLQFFDVRAANACETESIGEYPAGRDLPPVP